MTVHPSHLAAPAANLRPSAATTGDRRLRQGGRRHA